MSKKRGLRFSYQNLTAAAGAFALAFAVERAIPISAILLSLLNLFSFCFCSLGVRVLVHTFFVLPLRTLLLSCVSKKRFHPSGTLWSFARPPSLTPQHFSYHFCYLFVLLRRHRGHPFNCLRLRADLLQLCEDSDNLRSLGKGMERGPLIRSCKFVRPFCSIFHAGLGNFCLRTSRLPLSLHIASLFLSRGVFSV